VKEISSNEISFIPLDDFAAMENRFAYSDQNRLIAKILNLYYLENLSQAKIAQHLGLSNAKVNRLLKTARQAGMVEINIHLPYPNLFGLEERLRMLSGLVEVIVTPSIGEGQEDDLHFLTRAAANYLVNQIKPKDTLCIGGGKTLSEVVSQVNSQIINDVRIYPAIGGLPRTVDGDVNGLASRLAQELGGEAAPFFAPAFAVNRTERDTILSLSHVMRSLDLARTARIGLFGIGSLQMDSSIIRYCPLPYHELANLAERSNSVGEILGYIIDGQGEDSGTEVSELVIGISLDDVRKIPIRIGVAAGAIKGPAIAAAIKGKYFTTLVINESAARPVIEILERK
jgi:DNA-binding transcriptional regulator LsrR (DeoR family)